MTGAGVAPSGVPRLFDAAWYLEQYPEVARFGLDPWQHYLERGGFEGRNPNPLFDSAWYRARLEPSERALNPLCHYLEVGEPKGLDPHPLMDSATYRLAVDPIPPGVTALEAFLSSGVRGIAGAYLEAAELEAIQQAFLGRVTLERLEGPGPREVRFGVFLQCGVRSLHPEWLTSEARPFDLIVNHYDQSHERPIDAEVRFRQSLGTKFTALHRCMLQYPGLLERYDYLFLLDDDIRVSLPEITRLFTWVEALGLDLAQPSLMQGSNGTWPCLFTKPGSIARYLTAVEIMMPVLSRRALQAGRHLFAHSVSGWGLDFALADEVRRRYGAHSVGVIDAIAFSHECPINLGEGAYYRMLRDHDLSALVEERVMGDRYGARGPIDDLRANETETES